MSRDNAPNFTRIEVCMCCATCDNYDHDSYHCNKYEFFNEESSIYVCDDWPR